MANELLDFVMSLVRDPGVAAQYAADPAQAIADAHLTNVTSADVNNLIPMVSDSFATFPGATSAADHNVWTSGAATAAFDAFDAFTPHAGALPDQAAAAVHDLSGGVIDAPTITQTDLSQAGADLSGGGFEHFDPAAQLGEPGVDPAAVDPGGFGLGDHVAEHVADHVADHGAFDQLSSDIHHLDADHFGV